MLTRTMNNNQPTTVSLCMLVRSKTKKFIMLDKNIIMCNYLRPPVIVDANTPATGYDS